MNEEERKLDVQIKCKIHRILQVNGIKRNSNNAIDYSRAKQIIIGDNWFEKSDQYNFLINTITDYLNF